MLVTTVQHCLVGYLAFGGESGTLWSFLHVDSFSNLILTILFVGLLKLDWYGRVYAQLLTCLCFSVVALVILVRKGYFKRILPLKKDFVEGYKFGIPLIPHSTSFWLRQGLDRYIINSFLYNRPLAFLVLLTILPISYRL